MFFYDTDHNQVIKSLGSSENLGLNQTQLSVNLQKYGKNSLSKVKKSRIKRIFSVLKEPMLIILLFGFVLALGVNIGRFLKTGEADFAECFGILFAVILSVSITIVMEGSSEKAFLALNKIYDNVQVKVIREGKLFTISQKEISVGDVILLESGDKIFADGRLITTNCLSVDESALTGESHAVEKNADVILDKGVPLAERINMVYSGTFVVFGSGKMIVTAVGDKTEMGNVASELKDKTETQTPLQQKMNKLGKIITITGGVCAIIVFVLSVLKLLFTGSLTFNGIQELFVSCIVLIVAAVPEGLPTIVAVSLALNMIKLAKEKTLIKKMTATETAGAVSVICSDKTGTLTQNKMTVLSVCLNEFCTQPERVFLQSILQNFACNNTAEIVYGKNNLPIYKGSATECALLTAFEKNSKNLDCAEFRKKYPIIRVNPFSSERKIMSTVIMVGKTERELIKGAPEIILQLCNVTETQKQKINYAIVKEQRKARRILCFAHRDNLESAYIYDGFVSIADPVRPEVKKAVEKCKKAGIKIKILTGDNVATAFAIAKELDITNDERSVINGSDIDKLDDNSLKKILPKITVIARSTPLIKLRVVKALKELGEVVAVTGDGINDAPAIKHADVGFAMGKTGSDITKESADVVLLDDSFSGVVKAVAFGRNVYRNLQRFIIFQLSVNLSALLFVTVCAILGLKTPFNTIQLLWINIIMDGPPALTLGLEYVGDKLMENKPLKRSQGIVGKKMFLRILFNGIYMASIMICQYLFNFMQIPNKECSAVIFTLFVLFQLFNAFNSRVSGTESVFKSITKNKIMLVTFESVFILHFIVIQFLPSVFGVSPLSAISWIKCLFTSFSILAVTELGKLLIRIFKINEKGKSFKKTNKIFSGA